MALLCAIQHARSISAFGCLSQLRLLSTTASSYQPFGVSDNALIDKCAHQLDEIKAAGTYKLELEITTPQGASVGGMPARLLVNHAAAAFTSGVLRTFDCKHVGQTASALGTGLTGGANNYLGLSNHPDVVAAAHKALDTHGFGLSSVRFICGTQDLHKQLEAKISTFHGTQDTILYPSCFDANAGLFEVLLGPEDAVISDELNHASIIDGIRLCKAKRYRFKHMDMLGLEHKLMEADEAGAKVKLIATDGVFSMDGHVAPIGDIVALARHHGAQVFVDECHATGFVGATGRGTDEYWNVRGQVDIINSTLGKALGGGTGGYTTGRAEVVSLLRQRSRPYLFSNTLAPSVAAASIAVFDMLSNSHALRDKLQDNTDYFRREMTAAGFDIKPGNHPIVPIMLGDAALASKFASSMLQHGVYVVGFSYPVVPKGQARIRVQLSAAHEKEHLDAAIAAFKAVGKELGVIS